MTTPTPPDPAAFFREMLGQWEDMANRYGGAVLKSGEAARVMGAATSLNARAREMTHEAMSRGLAAANMPSRDDVIELGERVAALDARLARIEAMLATLTGAPPKPERPKPARSRKPPSEAV